MGLAERADLVARLTLDGNFAAKLKANQSALGKFQGSLGRTGRGVGQIAGGLTRAATLIGGAVVTGVGAAAKVAVDFEDAFAGVRKTVNEADLAAAGLTFDDLAKQFRDMSTEIPITAVELAKIGEIAGALGVKATDIDDFTKTVALLGETTDLTSDAAAEALGKVGTILDLSGGDFEDFADTLVNLGNQGASTESEIIEITKRFAGMGKQAGLSTDEILALSSAAASLGIEPEAAGGALSRIFSNMSTEIANGTAKGKEFAKITGDSLDDLRKRIDKGDALGILMDTLEGIQGLSRTEGASVLKALGITNQRDRNAILNMANNLDFVNEQLEIAKESEGSLLKEAEKRFATTASKIQLLKNNLIETGIAVGTEMLPAIGRALDKAIGLLKDPAFKAEAVELGKDIGKFIDDIDWNKVKDGALALKDAMKGAVDFALLLISALDKLPNEIKGAAVGFLALNKLSGGLLGAGVGNLVGGLAETVARAVGSQLPGVGKLFTQPVFVTNWPMGGLGGAGGGAAGGGGGLAAAAGAAIAGGVAIQGAIDIGTIATGVRQGYQAGQAGDVQGVLAAQKGILDQVVLFPSWLRDLGLTITGEQQKLINSTITVKPEGISPDERQELNDLQAKAEAQRQKLETVRNAAERTKASVDWSRQAITAGGHSDASMIVSAIRANRTIVNVSLNNTLILRRTYSTGTTATRTTSTALGGPLPVDSNY